MNIKERIRKMGPFIALVVTFIRGLWLCSKR